MLFSHETKILTLACHCCVLSGVDGASAAVERGSPHSAHPGQPHQGQTSYMPSQVRPVSCQVKSGQCHAKSSQASVID